MIRCALNLCPHRLNSPWWFSFRNNKWIHLSLFEISLVADSWCFDFKGGCMYRYAKSVRNMNSNYIASILLIIT